ncbi:hypothetical protein LTR95_001236 [Oleoguttula sp. CCFEE 5521]
MVQTRSKHVADAVAAKFIFPFLDLPPELQLNILEHALVKPEPIRVTPSYWFTGLSRKDRCEALPPLLRVSQQIRADALKLHFTRNEFFDDCSWRTARSHNRFILAAWVKALPSGEYDLVKLTVPCTQTKHHGVWRPKSTPHFCHLIASLLSSVQCDPVVIEKENSTGPPEYSVNIGKPRVA